MARKGKPGSNPTFGAVAALFVAGCLLWQPCALAWQESVLGGVSADTVNAEQIESAINAVQAQSGLDDEARASLVEQLRGAQAQLQARAAADAAAAEFAAALDTAPAETEALRERLQEAAAPTPTAESLGIRDSTPLADVEQLLAKELAVLSAAETRLAELDSRVPVQEARPGVIRQRIEDLRARRVELDERLGAAPPPNRPQILTDARRLVTELQRARVVAELGQLDQELLSHGVRLELLRAQRDAAARALAEEQRVVAVLQQIANRKRQAAATLAQQEAALTELAAEGKHPAIRALAEGNAELTRELPAIAAGIERSTQALTRAQTKARQLEEAINRTRQRIEVGGVSQAIGRLLVEERQNLPQVSSYREEVSQRRRQLGEIGLAQVRLEEQRRELTPIDQRLEEAMQDVAADVRDEAELEAIRAEVGQLLQDRRQLLSQAASNYSSYLQVLGDLDIAQRRLLDLGAEYRTMLDEHSLWIPSADVVGGDTLRSLGPAVAWALSPQSWAEVFLAVSASLGEHMVVAVIGALALAALLLLRRPLARYNAAIRARIGKLSMDNIYLTIGALGIVAVRAMPLPLLLALVGLAILHSPRQFEFASALAQALHIVAPFLYNVLVFRDLFRPDGVARTHFGWHEQNLAVTRRLFDRLAAVAAPLILVAATLYWSQVIAYRESLGRLSFVALLLVFAIGVRPLLHPEKGVVADYYRGTPTRWVTRLRWVWYVFAAGAPLALALISLLGFLYTAVTLTGRLIDTFWLALMLVIVDMVVLRWLALARRKLEWQMALKRREERKAAGEKEATPASEGEIPVPESRPLDLDEVDQQTQRLLRAGLLLVGVLVIWAIWADVLPALGALEDVALWSQKVTVEGVESVVPVTLADLLFALVIVAVTAISAKNLPGLMEIAILQRLTLQPGSRYAINTLLRYSVVTVGAIAVLNIVGWNWSQIQWLVAALSVGLGFGLQEIVANFVSGLIILFERPVRVGDTVTVGELTGTVSRVQIRATTITDWDRKEIIVPNKAFITSEVVNWTLSDPITRIVLPVGISYGSDVVLAQKVMEDTLARLPLVLDEPPPKVYFLGFGESSLDFKLYVYSRELADRLPLTHAVHQEILAALREHGIEIPFPQRDLHVRSVAEGVTGVPGDRDEGGDTREE